MNTLHRNIRICVACVKEHGVPDTYRWPCPVSGRHFLDHAEVNICPAAKYPRPGLGDWVKLGLRRAGIEKAWKWLMRHVLRKEPEATCAGCEKRREALNRIA